MAQRLLPAGDGKTSDDPKDSLDLSLDNQIRVFECLVTLRAHPQNRDSICPRVAGLPEQESNAKIDRLEYELSMNPRVWKYPPAIQTSGDALFQE